MLRQKEVVNITDGRRLGFINDLEIDEDEGTILAAIIPRQNKLFGIAGRENELVIPWNRIKRIGEDIVLVELDERFLRRFFDP